MDAQVRQRLVKLFRADILELQEMIGRDLSHWLQRRCITSVAAGKPTE
jgi:hypothetical protein